ncbi:MAG TPA: HAMP domain-containing sensor histidine kinase [Vicinamibacteria bacterium]
MPGKKRGPSPPSVPVALAEPSRSGDARDELLSALSHDVRSPLGSLLVWLELLRGEALEPSAARVASRVETSVRDLRDMILRFLDMSQVLSGTLGLEAEDVDPRALVDAALETVRAGAETKGVRLVTAFDASMPPLRADARSLSRGLECLLANALRATPPGGSVEVRVEGTSDRISFRVRDSGAGLRPEGLASLREALAAGIVPDGGGFRLAVALGVARLHRGGLHAASEGEGRGSELVLELPLVLSGAGSGAGSP